MPSLGLIYVAALALNKMGEGLCLTDLRISEFP